MITGVTETFAICRLYHIGRATVDLESKIWTAEENLIVLPK